MLVSLFHEPFIDFDSHCFLSMTSSAASLHRRPYTSVVYMKGTHTGSFHLSIPLLPSSHRETPVIDPRNNVVEEGIACSSWKGTLSRFISKKKKKLALDETR